MSIYDDFIQFGDDQDLFDKWGCQVCGGRAPTDCQGVPADDVHHEPFCPVPGFIAALWKVAQQEQEADRIRRILGDPIKGVSFPPPVWGRRCTCQYVGLGGNDPDGYIRRDRDCPIHGADPDHALEAKRDEAMERAR